MGRRFFVGGNWKCFGTVQSVNELVKGLNDATLPSSDIVEIVVAPVALHLGLVRDTIRKEIKVSAQNCHYEGKGAFTGEINADQLKDFGIEWTIIGHSERRNLFHETDDIVAKKVGYAQGAGLNVIACVGEHLSEREAGKTQEVVFRQLKAIADQTKDWNRLVIAYEPVWAIGTGKTATPEMAQEVHAAIRQWLKDNVSAEAANSVRILYGGSVKPNNANDLAAQEDVDGFLVGGASLVAKDFLDIVQAVHAKKK